MERLDAQTSTFAMGRTACQFDYMLHIKKDRHIFLESIIILSTSLKGCTHRAMIFFETAIDKAIERNNLRPSHSGNTSWF